MGHEIGQMSQTMQWAIVLLEGGILLGVCRGLVLLGSVLQMIKDHDRRIEHIEERLDARPAGAHR